MTSCIISKGYICMHWSASLITSLVTLDRPWRSLSGILVTFEWLITFFGGCAWLLSRYGILISLAANAGLLCLFGQFHWSVCRVSRFLSAVSAIDLKELKFKLIIYSFKQFLYRDFLIPESNQYHIVFIRRNFWLREYSGKCGAIRNCVLFRFTHPNHDSCL